MVNDFKVIPDNGLRGGGASFESNVSPAKVYIGGDISLPTNFDMPVLEGKDEPHDSSGLNYGNLAD